MSAVLEAKDAIRELMAAYAHALDACRFADVAACFAPDGEWTTDYGAARGPAEIEAFIRGIVPVKGEGPQRKHYITNIIIKVDGETASAVSDYLIVREAEAGLIPVMGGTYRDKFIKTPAGWRFSRKELEHHIAGDMALKNGR
jgi:ketosteroid isomerase-like protein